MGTDKAKADQDQLFENFISIEQLAELIGRKPKTIVNWCHERKIPHIKAGSRTLFLRSSVYAWLASSEVKNVKKRR